MGLGNLRISVKLGAAFAALTVGAALMGVIVFMNMRTIQEQRVNTQIESQILVAAKEARAALGRQENSLRGYIITKDDFYSGRVKHHYEAFSAELAKIAELTKDKEDGAEDAASLKAIADSAAAWHANVADPAIKAASSPVTYGEAIRILTSGIADKYIEPVENGLDAFADEATQRTQADFALQQAAYDAALLALGVGVAVLAALAIAFGWLSSRVIARPVLRMAETMKDLARGNNDVDVPFTGRGDEIGQMAGTVLTFKEAALEKERVEAEATAQRGQADAERRRNEEMQTQASHEQSLVVGEIGTGLARLSDGDLTYRIAAEFPGEYRKLKDDFNGAMSQMQDAMKTIARATEGIRSGTGEISQASDDLSRRTEQQAASLEETAAALDEITATVKRTAEGSNHARDVVGKAKSDAEQSGEVVKSAVGAMTEIEGSSKQISQIIGVIDEIAFQTNLLALNAGVEAARAGEAGKGFAVVAQEVRALAQRSADAAKEIKTLIQTSSGQVEQGVSLVGRAGEALARIVEQVTEINGIVRDISASAQEQATGLAEVNTAVNQMDQVTQQNAAMVEQATAAAHGLSNETGELVRLVAGFKLGEGDVATATRPAPAAPQARKAARPAVAGNTALKMDPVVENDWEEF